MSWDAYVQHMMKNGSMCYAAIIGNKDGAPWALSQGFNINTASNVKITNDDFSETQITVNERAQILEAVNSKSEMKSSTGLFINGVKFMTVGWNEEEKSCYIAARPNFGGILRLTNQTIQVGIFDKTKPGQNSTACNKDTNDLATKLIGANF